MDADRERIPQMVTGIFVRCAVCTALARNRHAGRKAAWGPRRPCPRCRRLLAPDTGPPKPRLWPLDGSV